MAVTEQFHALRALNPKKHHSCPLNQMLDEPWIWSRCCEGVSNLLPMLEIEPRFLCRLARSLGTTSTELSQLATVHWDRPQPIPHPLHTILSYPLLLVQRCETATLRRKLEGLQPSNISCAPLLVQLDAMISGTYPDFT